VPCSVYPYSVCVWCCVLCALTVCWVPCTVCTYSVGGAVFCVLLQCAWCHALCAHTVCVVLCSVCSYSLRSAMHCVHIHCAWCCALCAPTVCVVLCTVCTYSMRGAVHWVNLQCGIREQCELYPATSSPLSSQWKALSEKPVVSHLAWSHTIQKYITVSIAARHISTTRAS
jgi:hypothetical protein